MQREGAVFPLHTCSPFQKLLRKPNAAIIRRIQGAICDRERLNIKVCCPGASAILLPVNTTLPVNGETLLPETCGTEGRQPLLAPTPSVLIIREKRQAVQAWESPKSAPLEAIPVDMEPSWVTGGRDVELRQPFPWMALLGYNSRTRPIWGCGGSLITQQYVITAAHCVHPTYVLGLDLQVIRLGELNLATERDCTGPGYHQVCAPPPQDFSPTEIIIHPDFDKRTRVSDDIALIRLDRKAKLGPFVTPLCLPPAGLTVQDLVGSRLVEVAGWGLKETAGKSSQVLQRASLPFFDKARCNPIYNNSLVPEQICFGGGPQDSCQGDSGGPIFIRRNFLATLVGVVSRGLDFRCGLTGVPAVYTDATAYRPWIISNLKP